MTYLKNALLYIVYLFGASLLALVMSILSYIVNAITMDEYIRTLFLTIIMILSMIITLYIIFYQLGYKRASSHENYKKFELLISILLTIAIHFIIALLSNFFSFLYLPVAYLGGLIIGNTYIDTIASLVNTHFHIMILSYFLMMIPLIASMIFGFNKGAKKRQKDRKKVVSGN
ncbi:MAG: hypothetical protein FWF92_03680 [Oscillospiraceae bacterium]|nr:hypothetical protein [Oscillospiraceae bacterium]